MSTKKDNISPPAPSRPPAPIRTSGQDLKEFCKDVYMEALRDYAFQYPWELEGRWQNSRACELLSQPGIEVTIIIHTEEK